MGRLRLLTVVRRPAWGLKISASSGLLMLCFNLAVQNNSSRPLLPPPCLLWCSRSRSSSSRLSCGLTTWSSCWTWTMMPLLSFSFLILLTSLVSTLKASASNRSSKPPKRLRYLSCWPLRLSPSWWPLWFELLWLCNSCCGFPAKKNFWNGRSMFDYEVILVYLLNDMTSMVSCDSYPEILIKLVGSIASVKKLDKNKRGITIVIKPISHSWRHGDNITLSNLLMLVLLCWSSELSLRSLEFCPEDWNVSGQPGIAAPWKPLPTMRPKIKIN